MADAYADSFDLLAGIMLVDPRDNPARDLLSHFDIPPGAVLRHDGVLPPSAPALLAAVRQVARDGMPPTDSSVLAILDRAQNAARPNRGLISIRELFGALLDEWSTPASSALREQLKARGVDGSFVARTYSSYLAEPSSYREFLRSNHAYAQPVVELANYLADQPQARGATADRLPDLVGIDTEVDAFAYLVSSTVMSPPLAIGLFGDWGSGKSFFMRSLQRRVDRIAQDVAAQDDETAGAAPFHRNIVQIEFNAWQYVGGDLWASLLEHLFRNLRRSPDDTDNLLALRQKYWVQRVKDAKAVHAEANAERQLLEEERNKSVQEVEDLRTKRDEAQANFDHRRKVAPLAAWSPTKELRDQITDAVRAAGFDTTAMQADELATDLNDARDALRGAGAVLAPLRAGGWRYALAVLFLLGLTPLVAWGVAQLDWAPLASVSTTVASLLATVGAYVRLATRYVRGATARIERAQTTLAAAEHKELKEYEKRIVAAQNNLDDAQKKLAKAERRERDLAEQVDQLTADSAAVTARTVLREFLTERTGSDDYRKHLGVAALVRRDLQRLSQLVEAHRENPDDDDIPDDYAIDRIVLYIDDLDRCPTPLVIQVLEAVHLLLAFPLFVVVVAVDSRWLESSLREHYTQLSRDNAVPADYLEKIFQIPFQVRELGTDTRQQLVRGLLTPNLVSDTGDRDTDELAGDDVQIADMQAFREVVASFRMVDQRDSTSLGAKMLTIGIDELEQVANAADLVGPTPRALKRFVNIYLLTKSIGVSRGWQVPTQGGLAVLTAIAIGMPTLAKVLLPKLGSRPVQTGMQTLGGVALAPLIAEATQTQEVTAGLTTQQGAVAEEQRALLREQLSLDRERAVLDRWIRADPGRSSLEMSDIADWIDVISRFRLSLTSSSMWRASNVVDRL